MTWLSWHKLSERLASDAHIALREGKVDLARKLFSEAAAAETQAIDDLDETKTRTLGVTAVSAASLWFKGNAFDKAERLAGKWLASESMPPFAIEQLRQLLQTIWTEREKLQAGVSFLPGQVIVAVKGGEVVRGGAPLDLIVDRVRTVESLFYRTIEHLKCLPHRKRGLPDQAVQAFCRPWLFQTLPGSYQFVVAIQGPGQPDLFIGRDLNPTEVVDHFLSILRASTEAPEEKLPAIVPERDYRGTFLKLARNLAPTGKSFSEVEIRAAGEFEGIRLDAENRAGINNALRKEKPKPAPDSAESEDVLYGVLRGLQLDADWIEVLVESELQHIMHVGDTVDDVIGPMVNHRVKVQVLRTSRGLKFVDMELDE